MGAEYDVTIGGYKARLARSMEGPTFRPFFSRQPGSAPTDLGGGASKSNAVRVGQRQTGWHGGSTWWRPLLRLVGEENSYFTANGMDAYSKPGYIFPRPNFTQGTVGVLPSQGSPKVALGDILYFMSDTLDTGNYLLAKLEDGTFSTVTGATAGSSDVFHGFIYDQTDSYFYVLSATHISRVQVGGTENNDWISLSGFAGRPGQALLLTPYEQIWFYDASIMRQLDKAGPNVTTTITNDGMGVDALNEMSVPANPILYKNQIHLAVSTSEGIYYVKNVRQGGVIQPWIYRIERDEAGIINSVPIANLPPNTVVLGITSFLDSIILSYTHEVAKALKNDQADPYIVALYHISGGNKGVLGVLQGEDPDDSATQFLGADEKYLYIGGFLRIWAYDGVRGGLHPLFERGTQFDGSFTDMAANTVDSGGKAVQRFFGSNVSLLRDVDLDTDEVTNFGDDLVTHRLESNPFDFGRPFELKTLSRVWVNSEDLAATQQYTIRVKADDGAYQTVAQHTGTNVAVYNIASSNIQGYEFVYEIIWEAKAGGQTYPSPALRDLLFDANHGEMIAGFEVTLDGTQLINIENEVVDVATFFDNMMAVGATATPVTFTHRLSGHIEQDEENTYTVIVQQLSIDKGGALEAAIRMTLLVA